MKKYSTRKIHRRLKMYRALLIAGGVALLAFPVAVNTDMVSQRYQILINGSWNCRK